MSLEYPIFRTRLIPPQEKQTILQRPQINKKLQQIMSFPLTLIYSGPGYGKSTTLASFSRKRHDACWYSISEKDDDIVIFLHYLIHSVRLIHPHFGERLFDDLDRNSRTNWLTFICSEFVNECSGLEMPTMLILDDFHLVEHSPSICEWMQILIENIPDNVHLVISGRSNPEWQVLMKLKAKGDMLIIDEGDFTFTYDEIDVLFNDNYQMALESAQIAGILKMTEGWVMAIQLIGQQSKDEETLEKILVNKNRSLKDLFQYLTLEVFVKLPTNIQDFLRKTCIFEELNPMVISKVLKIRNALGLLKRVVSANLFLSALDKGNFRYHALFRNFLIEELHQNNPSLYENLHREAGRYFEENQYFEQAIYHYEAIRDFRSAAKILSSYGRQMIKLGWLEKLREKLVVLPSETKDQFAMLRVYEGEIYRYRCQYGQALESYRRAEQIASKEKKWREQSAALEGIAQVFLDTIQPGKADEFLKQAVEVIPENESVNDRRDRLSRLMAENLVNLGRAREAEKWLKIKPGEVLINVNNEKLEPRLLLRMGRFDEAIKLLEYQKREEQKEVGHLQQSHRETDLLLSLIYSFQGDALKAKALAQEGIIRGVKYAAPFVEACGWIRIGHSVQISLQYDLNQAMTCYKTALRLMDDIQMPRGKAEPLMGLCGVYSQIGDYVTAIHYGERALDETDKVSDEWLSALIRLSLGIVYFYLGDYERCAEFLNQCDAAFEICGDEFGIATTTLWKMIMTYEKGDWTAFEGHLLQCLHIIEKGHYDFLLERRTLFGPYDIQKIPQILLVAKSRGIATPFIQKLLLKWNLTDERNHPGYTLHVQMLGQFRVWLGHQEVSPESWQRSKTKELFQILITRRNTWLSKEDIMALLWTDQDRASADSGFKVALNTLNKVLEPRRKVRGTPYFIDRSESLYRLNLIGIVLDVDDFEKSLQRAAETSDVHDQIQLLEVAIAYYQGDYLPERRFEDWCVEERERLQLLFLKACEKLAQLYISQGKYNHALEHCERILQVDSCWEESYRMIMHCYYRQNNRPQAMKYYKKCCMVLEKVLGIEPMPITTAIYQKMLEGESLV